MKTKLFLVKVFSWKTELFNELLEFKNTNEAQTYAMGLYEGFRLCGKSPTGFGTRIAKKSVKDQFCPFCKSKNIKEWCDGEITCFDCKKQIHKQ